MLNKRFTIFVLRKVHLHILSSVKIKYVHQNKKLKLFFPLELIKFIFQPQEIRNKSLIVHIFFCS